MTPAPPAGHVEVEHEDGMTIVRVFGDVDLANVDEISAEMAAAVPNTAIGVVVDLSETCYLDSLGLHMLVDFEGRLHMHRQELRIAVREDSLIRKLLRLTCLDQQIGVHPTVANALKDLGDVASGPGRSD